MQKQQAKFIFPKNKSQNSKAKKLHKKKLCFIMIIFAVILNHSIVFGFQKDVVREHYTCTINGVYAQMVMEINVTRGGGLVYGPGPMPDASLIPDGSINVAVEGTIQTQNGINYVFDGENGYADVVDKGDYSRFRVRLRRDSQNKRLLWILSDPTDIATKGQQFAHKCIMQSSETFQREYNFNE